VYTVFHKILQVKVPPFFSAHRDGCSNSSGSGKQTHDDTARNPMAKFKHWLIKSPLPRGIRGAAGECRWVSVRGEGKKGCIASALSLT
jgi:hypothetical protein